MQQTQLRTSPLGRTGLEITRVGFGAWAIGGGGWEFGWGPQQDDESVAAIGRALELGVNWIDTAAAYGFGRSEQIVGRALEGVRERPYVFTKCSLLDGHPAADGAIAGFRRPAQVGPILAAAGLELTDQDITEFEAANGPGGGPGSKAA
jgi:aryl-alcohol dehydrogenase-like predicted oxidoreductase